VSYTVIFTGNWSLFNILGQMLR